MLSTVERLVTFAGGRPVGGNVAGREHCVAERLLYGPFSMIDSFDYVIVGSGFGGLGAGRPARRRRHPFRLRA